ncbi:hypothetical protein PTTG_28001 [Puccinia triticina 1-1 BBBD Race 1]|uniref:W2 domain-containing protein n=1 Tax=Puccinia triticina (isolate 1-1 / race 1 (BBBD)) TaxID=630390 RepID=A0A180GFI9_PUCT1|nr:hypothetical protein PTTG_28001 [Puccinia triticina 1-1 BBBD Race 1]
MAVKARMKSVEAGIQNGHSLVDEDNDDSPGKTYTVFSKWILTNRESVLDPKILVKAKELGIKKKNKTVQTLALNFFTENTVKEVSKYHALFAKVISLLLSPFGGWSTLLGGIEQLCREAYPSLVPLSVPKIIMEFYQANILEEDVIKQWGTHVSKKFSHTFLSAPGEFPHKLIALLM